MQSWISPNRHSSPPPLHPPPEFPFAPPPPAFHCPLPTLLIVKSLQVLAHSFQLLHWFWSSISTPHVYIVGIPKSHKKILSVAALNTHVPEGFWQKQVHPSSPMVWGWCLCAWSGHHQATRHGRDQSRSWPWWQGCSSIIVLQKGFFDLVRFYVGKCRIESHGTKYSLNR